MLLQKAIYMYTYYQRRLSAAETISLNFELKELKIENLISIFLNDLSKVFVEKVYFSMSKFF